MKYIYINYPVIKELRKTVEINAAEMVTISLAISLWESKKPWKLSNTQLSDILGLSQKSIGRLLTRLHASGVVMYSIRKNSYPEVVPSLSTIEVIKSVKEKDKTSGAPRTKRLGHPIPKKNNYNNSYSSEKVKSDTSVCPPDFQKKYAEYVEAYGQEYADLQLTRYNKKKNETNAN